jgi:tRNA threonylcarbamoyladenosine modification (KEOPS) complex  Pcc1 subunit
MNYKAEIVVSENAGDLQKCLLPEKISRERSTFKAAIEGGKLKITAEAKDAVAFRATMNAITQLMAVYGKAKEI